MRLVDCSVAAGERHCPAMAYYKGGLFAKAHFSTAPTPARQDARLPRTHEGEGRPQGTGGAPQEGTPSAYSRISRGARRPRTVRLGAGSGFRAQRGWGGGGDLTAASG